jgi:hypothetical protein
MSDALTAMSGALTAMSGTDENRALAPRRMARGTTHNDASEMTSLSPVKTPTERQRGVQPLLPSAIPRARSSERNEEQR